MKSKRALYTSKKVLYISQNAMHAPERELPLKCVFLFYAHSKEPCMESRTALYTSDLHTAKRALCTAKRALHESIKALYTPKEDVQVE